MPPFKRNLMKTLLFVLVSFMSLLVIGCWSNPSVGDFDAVSLCGDIGRANTADTVSADASIDSTAVSAPVWIQQETTPTLTDDLRKIVEGHYLIHHKDKYDTIVGMFFKEEAGWGCPGQSLCRTPGTYGHPVGLEAPCLCIGGPIPSLSFTASGVFYKVESCDEGKSTDKNCKGAWEKGNISWDIKNGVGVRVFVVQWVNTEEEGYDQVNVVAMAKIAPL